MISIKAGDWVRVPSLWRGVWMVGRVLEFKEDRWSLDDPLKLSNRTLVFCHRLFNDSWQRSFFHQSCDISLVCSLSAPDLKKVNALLSENAKLLAAFKKYQASAKPIDLVANLGFGGMDEKEVAEFPGICAEMLGERIGAGLTLDDVLHLLRGRGLDSKSHELPKQSTLQLICGGHELREDRFVYRRYRTLKF